jgi:hypothetical protein
MARFHNTAENCFRIREQVSEVLFIGQRQMTNYFYMVQTKTIYFVKISRYRNSEMAYLQIIIITTSFEEGDILNYNCTRQKNQESSAHIQKYGWKLI